ncbi:MAG: ammonium transporter [Rhodobacteraceae bacterium]|nr:ammonium transporter [Paracoccaceae bacterium]
MKKLSTRISIAALGLVGTTSSAFAQDVAVAVPTDSVFILNSLLFLIGGFLVFWMAAGFAMLEAGLVRSKNVTMQLTKNMALYASTGSDFFFQMMFCAATASIVSGTLAERIKLWPFLIFTIVLTAVIYPIQASWKWGGGFLDAMGFLDFAGSTVVHSVGGWAALMGALILGPRIGKYAKDGRVIPMQGSNLPLATLGTFILWMGWFGFNGGSQLAMGSIGDVADISRIFANTNAAAAGGAIVALILTQMLYRKPDLTMILNGALAGLVSITAEPLTPSLGAATLIGGIGGVIVVLAVPMLDRMKIDDVVGAIPVHLLAGIWGTLAVPLTNGDASFSVQIISVVIVGLFVCVTSGILWAVLKAVMGIRVSEEDEINGLDTSELGMEAYPEFSRR